MNSTLAFFLKLTVIVAVAIVVLIVAAFLLKIVLVAAVIAAIVAGGFFLYNLVRRRSNYPVYPLRPSRRSASVDAGGLFQHRKVTAASQTTNWPRGNARSIAARLIGRHDAIEPASNHQRRNVEILRDVFRA